MKFSASFVYKLMEKNPQFLKQKRLISVLIDILALITGKQEKTRKKMQKHFKGLLENFVIKSLLVVKLMIWDLFKSDNTFSNGVTCLKVINFFRFI
jgi:hypothetical protein